MCVLARSGEAGRGMAVEGGMLCSVQFGSVNSKAVIVWRGVVRRGRLWRSNYNNSH